MQRQIATTKFYAALGVLLIAAVCAPFSFAPGRTQDYENYVKTDVLPILQKAYPKGVIVSKVVFGGNGNQCFAVVFVDSFEELEKSAQVAVREGFTRIQPKTAGIILHTENTVLRYVPELSIRTEAQKAQNK
jgi:hypothetical protein